MGIRFRCHHCEFELHVKDFQAGRRGKCPECQGRFRIPDQDAAHSLDVAMRPEELRGEPEEGELRESAVNQIEANQVASVKEASKAGAKLASRTHAESSKRSASAGPELSTAGQSKMSPMAKSGAHAARRVRGMSEASTQSNAEMRSPKTPKTADGDQPRESIPATSATESEQWYVRHPTGGQYGPASSELLQQWLGEFRVTEDSLVWKTGWPEWQVAASAIPAHFPDASIAPAAAAAGHSPASPTATSELPTTQASAEASGQGAEFLLKAPSISEQARMIRKQRRKRNYIVSMVVLSVLAVILLGALLTALLIQ